MSQITPTEQDQLTPEHDPVVVQGPTDPNAPVSYVPHDASGAIPHQPVKFRSSRYGDLEEHELIRLLDTIEDERARSRFRESIYISCFVWLIIAWVAFYGSRYLWHAPRVINPMDVLKQREMTQLNFSPASPHITAPPRPAAPPPKLDNKTLERLREMTKVARSPVNLPSAPEPAKLAPTPANPAPSVPPPTAPTPNVRTPPPVVADAPTPQPSSRPNFNTGSASAGEAIKNALDGAAHDRGGSSYRGDYGSRAPLKMGGAEILSDTQNVNFNPYLQRILSDIHRNWMPLIPEEARPPLSKQGQTYIRFTILPDGNIADSSMHLDGSTHDDAINRSCWGAIVSEGQFPPLPTQFHGPGLELRIHFLVNEPTD